MKKGKTIVSDSPSKKVGGFSVQVIITDERTGSVLTNVKHHHVSHEKLQFVNNWTYDLLENLH